MVGIDEAGARQVWECIPRQARQGCGEMELGQKALLGQELMAQGCEMGSRAKNRRGSP